MPSYIGLPKRLLHMRGILLLTDVIKFVCQSSQVLGFQDAINIFISICLDSIRFVEIHLSDIICKTGVNHPLPRAIIL